MRAISPDGRFGAFSSYASNLVAHGHQPRGQGSHLGRASSRVGLPIPRAVVEAFEWPPGGHGGTRGSMLENGSALRYGSPRGTRAFSAVRRDPASTPSKA